METAIYSSKHILPVSSWTHTLDSVQCSKWFYNSRLSLHSCHCMAVTAWLFCMATMATAASNMKTRLGTDMYMLCFLNKCYDCIGAFKWLSNGFQMAFKCLSNAFQMAFKCLSNGYGNCKHILPVASWTGERKGSARERKGSVRECEWNGGSRKGCEGEGRPKYCFALEINIQQCYPRWVVD